MRFKINSVDWIEYPSLGLVRDENGFTNDCFVEVSSLHDLKDIQSKSGYELIVNFSEMTITIYDGYNE